MYTNLVNVFCGSGDALLPKEGSLCAKWFFPKAQAGNTVPHAARPFKMVTAGLYSGGYPTGYGVNGPNYNGRVPKFLARLETTGFTHFHHHGTGGIEAYYNYFRVTPWLDFAEERVGVAREEGRPGWYCAELENGIRTELAVADMAALHRYAFPREGGKLSVDFAQCGLDKSFGNHFYEVPGEVCVERISEQRAQGFMEVYGLRLYVSVWCPEAEACAKESTGVVFSVGAKCVARIALGFSFHSVEEARAHLDAAPDFDGAVEVARREWEEVLSAVRVETPDADLKRCFYSMLYPTLVKPACLDDPSPYDGSPRYYMDFATLWDQYKTQLPWVLTCCPQHAADMMNSLLAMGRKHGLLPCAAILNNRPDFCDYQARMLACYTICSAHQHGIEGVDYREALEILWQDLKNPRNASFLEGGPTERHTHILDLADGCHYLAQLAADLGDVAKHAELTRLARQWRNAFDPQTAMLYADKAYYEGTHVNYSFRLLHDMRGRMALFRDAPAFERALDRFFGFGECDAVQQVDPRDSETMRQGFALGRFEGFNNEPDMEAPYNYLFAGRHDKLCEILTAGMTELFSAERDGLPGNNDSGGLSSCYIWNTLGVFPAFASRLFLLGRPFFEKAELRLGKGKILQIVAHGLTKKNIYVHRVAFDGKDLNRFWLTSREFLGGGTLEFWMSECPCDTSAHQIPDPA